ncbi:pilus assembly protein [Pandoraea sp. ISTKB]|uniref:pilus assembly PilX family protein n=1 Tax=Pandoraea sp. ISTKB TaxID=1586708 RepID=UPI001112DBED|nr:pilus assembly protein [Pandoraea sp. ISTKB]
MVGVFMVMWLAALMALAASGMQHREMATRFVAYTNDRMVAFAAADNALVVARERLVHGAQASEIAALSEWDAGPGDVIAASYITDYREPNRAAGWGKVDWNGRDVVRMDNARYFIERIAFTGGYPDAGLAKVARESPIRRYRISAMGCAKLPGTRVFLQAIYEVKAQSVRRDEASAAARSYASRLLNWREVAAWHDSSAVKAVPGRRREHCDV